ncbi:MAG TPA: glycosyltransferase family 4 protein [Chloroflexota bacterium]|nr:glycosyltransferase family 4 protein [Chloroflexota bacterium]
MKLLLLSPYPSSAPSNRTRLEQYIPYLERHGFECQLEPFIDERAYRSRGPRRLRGILLGLARRARLLAVAEQCEAVFVHREATPLPGATFERKLAQRTGRLVFDFDDAIYERQPYSLTWPIWSPAKFPEMLRASGLVIAGNRHLAARAALYNSNVRVIPTPVDTDRIRPRCTGGPVREDTVIGWIGSPSTANYLGDLAPVLRTLLDRFPKLRVEIVGARVPRGLAGPRVQARAWTLAGEAADLQGFDIGIMPLPDNEWTRGKCGYKALQYMSAGVATVSAPVGVANDMIRHRENGLLAGTPEEWLTCLSEVIQDEALRAALGAAGRATAEARYSLTACVPQLLDAVWSVVDNPKPAALSPSPDLDSEALSQA